MRDQSLERSWSSISNESQTIVETVMSPSSVCKARRLSPTLKSQDSPINEMTDGNETILLHEIPSSISASSSSSSACPAPSSNLYVHENNNADNNLHQGVDAIDQYRLQRQRHEQEMKEREQIANLAKSSPPIPELPPLFLQDPPPMREEAWMEPDTTTFQIRGPSYLSDGRKVKSQPSVFGLLACDLVQSRKKPHHSLVEQGICSHPQERIQRALAREAMTGKRELPDFIFCVNLCLPSSSSVMYHQVMYFGVNDRRVLTDTSTPFGRVAQPFFFGDSDSFRDKTFKLIPRIVDGNMLVKRAVGSKPAILGRKVRQKYIKTDRYFELVVDVANDSVAKKIVGLSIGYAKTLVVEMGFVLEGHEEPQLPEVLMGAVRTMNIDFKRRDGQRVVH